MTTYNAYFRTDADWASKTFTAKAPEEALAKARAFHDEHDGQLLFQEYDGGVPVAEIEITGQDGDELAVWRDDGLRLQLASSDMLEALLLCEEVLAELARLDDGTPSISTLHLARAAIAMAEPPVASRKRITEPVRLCALAPISRTAICNLICTLRRTRGGRLVMTFIPDDFLDQTFRRAREAEPLA